MSILYSLLLTAFIFIAQAWSMTDHIQEERKIRRRLSGGTTMNHQPSLHSPPVHDLLVTSPFGASIVKQNMASGENGDSPEKKKRGLVPLRGKNSGNKRPILAIRELPEGDNSESPGSPTDPGPHRPSFGRRSRPSISFLSDPIAYSAPGRDSTSNTRRPTLQDIYV